MFHHCFVLVLTISFVFNCVVCRKAAQTQWSKRTRCASCCARSSLSAIASPWYARIRCSVFPSNIYGFRCDFRMLVWYRQYGSPYNMDQQCARKGLVLPPAWHAGDVSASPKQGKTCQLAGVICKRQATLLSACARTITQDISGFVIAWRAAYLWHQRVYFV